MEAIIHFNNGNTLNLDEFGTDQMLKSVHSKDLNNTLVILHIGDKTGRLMYSIPMSSVAYIEYRV